ncbi:transcriptional regulator [Streptomyces sp. Act143]|uniref:LCP family protein n=1 Tax=Streptomyces sp. Act143 TaxID=2200760 RepID=UPI000D678988|nr:LCP family protein [Streptomyces sp. Act143]PWI18302.1 transcriptional regulator [Streptomyces sp. Act143]
MTTKRTLSSLAIPVLVLAAATTLLGTSPFPERQAPRPLNLLLMGTDGRDTITADEKRRFHAGGIACNCTDVLMLVHVSARRDRVSVVSMPRDSYADIPPYLDAASGEERGPHPSKINGAYAEGGPSLTIGTVEAMTGVRIDRYLQVDFRRFIDAVDDVGGVEVCTPRTLKDSATKLHLKPGKHRLTGGPALQYVRSRHVDRSADLGRIQRQQRFLVNALRGLKAKKALTDPAGMARVVDTLLGSGRVEQGFAAGELVRLAAALDKVPARNLEFTTVPIAGFNETRPDVGSTLAWDRKRADAMFAKLRADRPLLKAGADPRPKDPPSLKGYGPVRGSRFACG